MQVVIEKNLSEQIEDLKEIANCLEQISNSTEKLKFITIKEFAKASGMNEQTVQHLFNRPDFPSCDFGKSKIAEVEAVKKYFSVPRRR